MKQSQLFTKTTREAPKEEKSVNAQLLIKAGFIDKLMAGVYSFLPLGFRVLKKIESIIREEMNNISGQEILLPTLHPKKNWEVTHRWGYKEMFKLKNRLGKDFSLGWTHEEIITPLVKSFVKSYKDLPVYIYQIQDKFRDELRAKSGLLRGVEFLMKDLYSFHRDEKDLDEYYEKVKKAYLNVFERCGLKAIITEASGGDFSKDFSHEFQVLAKTGEDTIIFCPNGLALNQPKGHFSQNEEVFDKKIKKCPVCSGNLQKEKSIEVGNIFTLGTKYSKALDALFTAKNGKKEPAIMGCYGLGISRLMGAIVEVSNDKKGIIWPKNISPFDYHLLPILSGNKELDKTVLEKAEKIYTDLQNKGITVLYDDRSQKSAGEKFADADLIGIPVRLVVSQKTMENNCVEVKERNKDKVELLGLEKIADYNF